ncbi:MAG: glycosyltransferase [Rhodobacter sp.]|nr:glycosyltransferase [Rhodobacter sp.]
MSAAEVSVIVVSLDRPHALRRCLTGIEQLDRSGFEVIVVADPAGLAALDADGFGGRIKTAAFETANISMARNTGLALAAGAVVAFIDDDAVPEPTWLTQLTAPFADPAVGAAGGYVIGRNGISLQYGARLVDRFGTHAPLGAGGDAQAVFDAPADGAVKTEGTNCAFRTDILRQAGGFDPAFAFFMDETDLNLRLAAAGVKTAVVPLAQVHHGFAASARRRLDRMPRTLFDIGASQVVLLRKHAGAEPHAPVLQRLRTEQRARLIRHLVAGACEPRDVGRLLQTLEAGIRDGGARAIGPLPPRQDSPPAFLPFRPRRSYAGHSVLTARSWSARAIRREAARLVQDGRRVSVFLFSPSAMYHRVRFRRAGFWEQTGGLFGRSRRDGPLIQFRSFRQRVAQERARVAQIRGLPPG